MSLRPIRTDSLKLQDEDVEVDADIQQQYWSLLGGVAWVVLVRGDIIVYVGCLQRAAKKPLVKHVLMLNRVVKWLKRRGCTLVFRHVPGPWRVLAILDSAFRAQEPDCLALRAAIIAVTTDKTELGGELAIVEFYSRKLPLVVRSTFGAESHGLADGLSTTSFLAGFIDELQYGCKSSAMIHEQISNGSLQTKLDAVIDAMSVFRAITADEVKAPSEKHLFYVIKMVRDRLEQGSLRRLYWADTRDMLCDCLTKGGIDRERLLDTWRTGVWELQGDPPEMWAARPGAAYTKPIEPRKYDDVTRDRNHAFAHAWREQILPDRSCQEWKPILQHL